MSVLFVCFFFSYLEVQVAQGYLAGLSKCFGICNIYYP